MISFSLFLLLFWFDKIQIDLNVNNYNDEIKRLRNEGKFFNNNLNDNNTNDLNIKVNNKNKNEKDILSNNEALNGFKDLIKAILSIGVYEGCNECFSDSRAIKLNNDNFLRLLDLFNNKGIHFK